MGKGGGGYVGGGIDPGISDVSGAGGYPGGSSGFDGQTSFDSAMGAGMTDMGAGGSLSGMSPIGGYGSTNLASSGTPGNLAAAGNPTNIPQNLYDQAAPTNLGGQNTPNIQANFQGFTETPEPGVSPTQPAGANPITSAGGQLSGQDSSFTQGWAGGPGATVESAGTGLSPDELSAANQAEAQAFGGTSPATAADQAQLSMNALTPSQAQISSSVGGAGGFSAGAPGSGFAAGAQAVPYPTIAGTMDPTGTTGSMLNTGITPVANASDPFGNAVNPLTPTSTPTVAAAPTMPAPAPASTAPATSSPAPSSPAGSSAAVAAQQSGSNAIPPTGATSGANANPIVQALSSMGLGAAEIAMLSTLFRTLSQHQNPQVALQQVMAMLQRRGAASWPGGPQTGQQLVPGQVITGPDGRRYRYTGGDPNQQTAWTPVTGSASGAPAAPPGGGGSAPASAPAPSSSPASLQA